LYAGKADRAGSLAARPRPPPRGTGGARAVRRLALPVVLAIFLGGCTIPQWNPAWVPAWVPLLGSDSGGAPSPRPAAPPRVVERAPIRPEDDDITERVVAVVNNDAITLGELEE